MKNKKYNVLIIEDSEDDYELYERTLTKAFDCTIEWCRMPQSALEILDSKHFDIALLDYQMPSMSGLDFMHEVYKRYNSLPCPIILLTGHGDENLAVKFMRLGISDYLNKKNISAKTLKNSIQNGLKDFQDKIIEKEKQVERLLFAHTIAHDLKSPLNRILSYTRFLSKKWKDNNTTHYVKNIHDDAQYVKDFLDDLLYYAEVGRSKFQKEDVDLNSVLEKSLHNLEIDIKNKNATIKMEPLPMTQGHAISLTQLFQNLISNALKYNEKKPQIEISCVRNEDCICVEVKDNGIGIEKNAKEDIFKPFTRLSNNLDQTGIGLGLAICDAIAKQHEAKIDLLPQPKGGTKAVVTFPIFH